MVGAGGVDAVLIGDDLPELGADLVAALAGLDVDDFDPSFSSGTTHTVLLPPDLAYGNNDGHLHQDTWMRFELTLNRLLPA